MELLKTGLQLAQGVKNAGRLRQVFLVFSKHGFAGILERADLARYVPGREQSDTEKLPAAKRLRLAFEELGPTFIKLGQLLAGRPDLLPDHAIKELQKLQDRVAPLDIRIVKKIISEELEKPIEEVFQSFEEEPLASASIGQVHGAVLMDGQEVVIKVQRPGIAASIRSDVSILNFVAGVLENQIPEARIINPKRLVDEFFRVIELELDYVIEMNNARRIAKNFKETEEIVIPKVYPSFSTHKILVMERLRGIGFNHKDEIERAGLDPKKLVKAGMRAILKMILKDGFFHGDLHGGNLFALERDRIGVVDFGMMGRLSRRNREILIDMFLAIVEEDYEKLCYEFLDLSNYSGPIDMESYIRDVSQSLSPYMGLSLREVNLGRVLMRATSVAGRHGIQIPGDWMLVFRGIFTIEGLGRSLYPEFDLLEQSAEMSRDIVKNRYAIDRYTKDLAWLVRDASQALKSLPRHLKFFGRKLTKNDYTFEIEIKELDELRNQIHQTLGGLGTALLSVGFLMVGSLGLETARSFPELLGVPWLSLIAFGLGLGLAIWSVWRLK